MGWGGVGTGGRAAGLGALVCGAGETGLPSTARSPTESPKDLVPGRPPPPPLVDEWLKREPCPDARATKECQLVFAF